MGNEASLEGEGQPGQPGGAVPTAGAPASISAPAGGGQLHKPSNGAPAGGMGTGHGPGMNRYPESFQKLPAHVYFCDFSAMLCATRYESVRSNLVLLHLKCHITFSHTQNR